MDYKPLNKPTIFRKVMNTAKWIVPAVLLLVEGCSNQGGDNRMQTMPSEPRKYERYVPKKDSTVQKEKPKGESQPTQDLMVISRLDGGILSLFFPTGESRQYFDSDLKTWLAQIKAPTIEGARMSSQFRTSGLTVIQIDPVVSTGMLMLTCSPEGKVTASVVQNQKTDSTTAAKNPSSD